MENQCVLNKRDYLQEQIMADISDDERVTRSYRVKGNHRHSSFEIMPK